MNYEQYIIERAGRVPGAIIVLRKLLKEKGPDVFERVAPNLGTDDEIWTKFKDECGQDLDTLVEKYGGGK